MTIAELHKLLKKLQDERSRLLQAEKSTSVFKAATTEDVESVRPEYDMVDTAADLVLVEAQIRIVKHRINVFNTTHTIEELGMTVDQVLIYLPQLHAKVDKLAEMSKRRPKTRVDNPYGRNGNLIEYEYANYDTVTAGELYATALEELSRVQVLLDTVNCTVDVD